MFYLQRFLHARPANHRKITVMALCQKKFGRRCCLHFGCRSKVESSENPFHNSRSVQWNFMICYWGIARRVFGTFNVYFAPPLLTVISLEEAHTFAPVSPCSLTTAVCTHAHFLSMSIVALLLRSALSAVRVLKAEDSIFHLPATVSELVWTSVPAFFAAIFLQYSVPGASGTV